MTDPDLHSLTVRVAQLEERMNTMHQKYENGIERLAREAAQRDKENTRWIVMAVVIIVGIGVAFLKVT